MSPSDHAAQVLQRKYYATTAGQYHEAHVRDDDPHSVALEYMSGLLTGLGARSILDVGSGTGRAATFLRQRHPAALVVGIEPVMDLLLRADRATGAGYVCGSGQDLPFPDDSFDVVCSTALLHHVPRPAAVISEMIRVARRAVMISDANRFGQGSRFARLTKLALWRAGAWPLYTFLSTRGRGYHYSAGDGIFYSYSIFDSAPALDAWADRTFVIPTTPGSTGYRPLLAAAEGLLVAVRETATPAGPPALPDPRQPEPHLSRASGRAPAGSSPGPGGQRGAAESVDREG
ncbi:class I SAM-dependent methyltransferase [Frankia tisae]|uniref:class I SAM-dependent methyltransferase n=1 Tax=Frankia tisae TaxID=2950104 RepID=UPI0021BE2605|nr:class I SAM-dependent methyltransferase [Frankia tisae]